MNREEAQQRIVLDLYGELSESEKSELESYLENHSDLRRERETYHRTRLAMDTRTPPDPGDLFWHGFTDRLETRMKSEAASDRPFSFTRGAIRIALATAAVLVIGFFAGRASKQSAEDVPFSQPVAHELTRRTADFLARSETLLIGFANEPDVRAFGLEAPRRLSVRLLADGDALRRSMSSADQVQVSRLVADLQAVLRQIANLETDQDALGLDLIQTGMVHGDLLFRINIEQIQSAKRRAEQSTRTSRL